MRWLLTGASGSLGSFLLRELVSRGEHVTAWSRAHHPNLFGIPLEAVDLADPERVARSFLVCRPDIVLHTAALASVAECYRAPEDAQAINATGTAKLVQLASAARARLVFVSTDLVFDGEKGAYHEGDAPNPLSVYGRSKLAGEQHVLQQPHCVVVRLSLLFGPTLTGRPSFFDRQVAALRDGRPLPLFTDEWRTPLGLLTAAQALLAVAGSDVTGLLHLGGPERMSRFDMGRRLAAFLGCDAACLQPVQRGDVPAPEPRPGDTSLVSARWQQLFPGEDRPSLEPALQQMQA